MPKYLDKISLIRNTLKIMNRIMMNKPKLFNKILTIMKETIKQSDDTQRYIKIHNL